LCVGIYLIAELCAGEADRVDQAKFSSPRQDGIHVRIIMASCMYVCMIVCMHDVCMYVCIIRVCIRPGRVD